MEKGKLVHLRHQIKGKTAIKEFGSTNAVTNFSPAPSVLYVLQNNT
jgi:hypothetical protein